MEVVIKLSKYGSADTTIKIWQSEYPYNCIANLTGHANSVFALAILNNSNKVSGSADTTIKIWLSEYPFSCIQTLIGHSNNINSLSILPNSNIVSCSDDQTIKIWNSTSFQLIATLTGHNSNEFKLAIS